MTKRDLESAANSSKEGGNEAERAPKRRKVRSCDTCRRQKARCEFTTSNDICHRCKAIGAPCVFDADAQANLQAASTSRASVGNGTQSNNLSLKRKEINIDPQETIARLEERLRVTEDALRLVLSKIGLPSLDAIARLNDGHSPSSPISASPVSAAADHSAELLRKSPALTNLYPLTNPIDAGIISKEQSTELTSIFEMRFNHCLYSPILKSQRMTCERPFTFTAMCALALRLKTTIPNQEEVKRKIHQLLQAQLNVAMSARSATVDAIHALLIISLWASVLPSGNCVGQHPDVPDGWHLLSTAVQMAQKLRLDLASGEVKRLLAENKSGHPEYEVALEKCRVWYTLVTYDTAMSLGSVKPRLTQFMTESDLSAVLSTFAESPSDRCLIYHLETLSVVFRIYKVHPPLQEMASLNSFIAAVDSILHDVDRIATTAERTCEEFRDNPQACTEFRMFSIYEHYAGCVFLSHACGLLSALPGVDGFNGYSFSVAQSNPAILKTVSALSIYIDRICTMAEQVLLQAFPDDSHELAFLSTAPDHLFTIISFSAAVLMQCQVTVFKYRPEGLPKAEYYDSLIARTSAHLARLAIGDSSLPGRYAQGLSSMLRRWKKQKAERPSTTNPHEEYYLNPNGTASSHTTNSPFQQSIPYNPPTQASHGVNQGVSAYLPLTGYEVPSIDFAADFLDPIIWLSNVDIPNHTPPSQ